MAAEPSGAGYGCREASEVMTGVDNSSEGQSATRAAQQVGTEVGGSFLSAEPAGREVCRMVWTKKVDSWVRQGRVKTP